MGLDPIIFIGFIVIWTNGRAIKHTHTIIIMEKIILAHCQAKVQSGLS